MQLIQNVLVYMNIFKKKNKSSYIYFVLIFIVSFILCFFVFGVSEYHAAEVSAKEVRWTFLQDFFQRGGIARVKRKMEMDKFAIEYYIKNHHDIPRFREPTTGAWGWGKRIRPLSRNIQLFCEQHRKVMQYTDLSGYLFCPDTKLRFISEREAIDLAKIELKEELNQLKINEDLPGYFDSYKSTFNWICRRGQIGPPFEFSTAELRNFRARKAILDPKIAEILKKNEDEFNKALQDMTQNDQNNRRSFNIVKYTIRAVLIILFLWAFYQLCLFCIAIKII